MELYAYRENGEFIGTIDFYTSLRWRRQYWTAGEVELHLPATKENLAAIQAGVILRRVGYTESARIMGIKTKGGEITANARMLEIYFSMAYVIGTKSFTGTPAEILCQLAEDARESVPELVVDKTALPSGAEITIQLDFKNTLKAMTAVAKAYGLGFRLLFSENQQFTFQVYEGTDRSADQADNNIVYFTDEFQNFIDPEYSFDESDYCNVAYARGSDGKVVCIDRSNGGRKRVCFVDASSITPDDKTEAAYPIYYDVEYEPFNKACGKATNTTIIKSALGVLEQAGYYAAVYCSRDFFLNYTNLSALSGFDKWEAAYTATDTAAVKNGLWQYSSTNALGIKGFGAKLDCDVSYVDYPAIMHAKGLNGYPKPSTDTKPAESATPLQCPTVGPMSKGDFDTFLAAAGHVPTAYTVTFPPMTTAAASVLQQKAHGLSVGYSSAWAEG